MPKATRYHLDLLFAIKNVELSEDFLEVKYDTTTSNKKYPIIKDSRTAGDIEDISI